MCQNQQTCGYRGWGYAVRCVDLAVAFLAFLFALALGVVLGAAYVQTFAPVLAAVIVFAAVMLVGVIALLIYRFCAYRR